MVVGAPSVHEAIRLQPLRRHVIKGGREVARSTVSQELVTRVAIDGRWHRRTKSERGRQVPEPFVRIVGVEKIFPSRTRAALKAVDNVIASRFMPANSFRSSGRPDAARAR